MGATMPLADWKISIISTDYDLHECRSSISTALINKGYGVIAFERPDYPYEPDLHSHDVCLNALQQCDIAILLIDKRYGGLYVGNTNISITEAEYDKLIESKKIILPFISKAAWTGVCGL